jgi:hypothetical protein
MNKRIIMLAALALASVACGDDDEAGPGTIIRNDGSVSPPIDAGAGGLDANIPQPDASAQTDSGSNPVVKGAPNCFAGTPTTSVQLLNACAEGYQVFDNSKRLPNFNGTLPSLP